MSLEELLCKQGQILHSINRTLANFKKLGQQRMTFATTTNRIAVLKEAFSQAQDLDARITATMDEESRSTHDYFTENRFENSEERYLEALDFMTEILVKVSPTTSTSQTVSHSSSVTSRLPRIHLPSFDGTFEAWESFRDRFRAIVIDNQSLSNVERLHYLCSALTGDAITAISHLPITDQNFNVAWKVITSRFENKRRLIMTHLNTLFSLPTAKSESPKELRALRDRISVSTQALRNLERPVDHWSDIVVFLGVQRLDRSSRQAWELKLDELGEFPTEKEFDAFLETRIRALEAMAPITESRSDTDKFKSTKPKTISAHSTTVTNLTCPICKQGHLLYQCKNFQTKSPSERFDFIKSSRRCVNCFSIKHTAAQCQGQHSCKECGQRHHTLLHFPSKSDSPRVPTVTKKSSTPEYDAEISSNLVSNDSNAYSVLLSTARVQVHSLDGRTITARALLDQGSVATLMTERLAQLLRLPRTKRHLRITGIGESQSVAQHAADIMITPEGRDQPSYSTTAIILRSLTTYVPPKCKTMSNWSHVSDVDLADRDPMSSDPIDVIVGADVYSQLILDGIRKGPPSTPVAQRTTLGWILSGPIDSRHTVPSIDVHHSTVLTDLDQTLRQFWEIEEIPRLLSMSPDEEKCEQHFQATHSRQPDGRYVVRLPFNRTPPPELGNSYTAALRSLQRIERRLQSNPMHADMYRAFMREYEALGHMQKVPSMQPAQPARSNYYIPHHAVFRDSSATTRLRVVFNASCRTTTGQSLNDCLLNGPKLQGDLIAILMRWRQFQFVYTADIEKMYRQIRVGSPDVDYQRILWRDSPSNPVEEYQLLTVTYGTTSAPFQALRVMRQLVLDEGSKFPLATPILQHQIYVDDCLFGHDNSQLLRQTRDQLNSMLAAGGFRLRKWASNDPSLLQDIDPTDHGLATSKTLQDNETVPILGVIWTPANDEFRFRIAPQTEAPSTKRAILSALAKLFDPLGWVAPVVIKAKLLMQQLWAEQCDWDDPIPDHLHREWREYRAQLPELETIQIPRRLVPTPAQTQTLHGFADASSKAYAAAVYVRNVLPDGSVWISLLISKSRVAPVKTISIPRLELCAAMLLARLINFVRTSMSSRQYECHCWTDSSITLTWLSHAPARWKTFVANRVSKIQHLLPDVKWHHVPTTDNPADCASRGMAPSNLRTHQIWWYGPSWLKQTEDQWPRNFVESSDLETTEARPVKIDTMVTTMDHSDLSLQYSSWPKLLRVTAYILRFKERILRKGRTSTRSSSHTTSLSLSPDEITKAKIHWLRQMQLDAFPREVQTLRKNGTVPKLSPLAPLVPYLDPDGLIRAKGRLSKSNLPESAKHPIILRSHPLLVRLITWTHLRHLHSGPQLTLACLRTEYWILRARATVRAVLHQCVACTRERATIPNELMGELPASRITQVERAFIHTGVDYAGPISVRTAPGRGHKSHKAYIAVFICLTTKAIHLELVSDYSSTAFVAAYHRFVSRRGLPTSMSSDNGTTFQGAERELAKAYRAAVNNADLHNSLAVNGVAWHFLPPAAPHFGGLWEAAVKSVKHHLKRCIGAHTLTFEEMATFLCRVEACLNSRPLAQSSESIDDYSTLTPGHFLIGSALVAPPEPSVLHLQENRLSRWQLIQRLTEIFWKAWTTDYMQTLHQRPKWRVVQGLTKVGQIVLLRNPNNPPCKWELGRISACHPGDDGIVRVVTVRTAQSEYKRPITKLCFLPVAINEQSELPAP